MHISLAKRSRGKQEVHKDLCGSPNKTLTKKSWHGGYASFCWEIKVVLDGLCREALDFT